MQEKIELDMKDIQHTMLRIKADAQAKLSCGLEKMKKHNSWKYDSLRGKVWECWANRGCVQSSFVCGIWSVQSKRSLAPCP